MSHTSVGIRRAPAIGIALLWIAGSPAARAGPETDAANAVCLKCHSDPELRRADGQPLPPRKGDAASLHGKAGIGCVDCHGDLAGVAKFPHKRKLAAVGCAECHDSVAIKHSFHPQMTEKPNQLACQGCHGSHDIVGTRSAQFKFAGANQIAACGGCHELARDEFLDSEHGRGAKAGIAEAPLCLRCHSAQLTGTAKRASKAALKQNQAKVCLACHLDNQTIRERISPSAGFIRAYDLSVHGRALASGNEKAPGCADCHGSHSIKKGQDSTSRVSDSNVKDTCGECHAEIAKQFTGSIHGMALGKGSSDAPTCTTCHGEHDILKHDDPRSPVAMANVSQKVCAPCHQSVKLSAKYGIKSDRFQTFQDSFHGLAMRGGAVEVANCASCHGVHDIKPSRDPSSRISPAHMAETCGKCHPGANLRFAMGAVHVAQDDRLLYWLSTVYFIFVIVVIGGMTGHNLLDFVKKSRRQLAIRRGEVVVHPVALPHRLHLRMTMSERLQHAAMALSFVTLVFTGFLLRYPDSWWAELIKRAWSGGFGLRGPTHRIAAVVMLAACAVHIGYVMFTERGRQFIRDLLPRSKDAVDAWGILKFNLGLRRDKPKLGRFSYVEKAEYWALVWGTFIMAVTGFIMWFDNASMGLLTKRGYDFARVIHFYEAWLAMLSILVWHLYFVIFNPDVYPMNPSWITGKLSEHEMAEEHPLELEQINRAEAAATSAPDPKGPPR